MTRARAGIHGRVDCPHCRAVNGLEATRETHTDTNGVACGVWRCTICQYEEGRPVDQARS